MLPRLLNLWTELIYFWHQSILCNIPVCLKKEISLSNRCVRYTVILGTSGRLYRRFYQQSDRHIHARKTRPLNLIEIFHKMIQYKFRRK